eukprot:Nitzschia sp. Nitz4//scaffold300_size22576//21614//22381//NITZ4_008546-RA/size22576-processed-gene-0.25-mRNA-1//-1//CDS//3329546991//7557//frame0
MRVDLVAAFAMAPSHTFAVTNWVTRPFMTPTSMVGRYVRVDPFVQSDAAPLWQALGGDKAIVNERLKWYGLPEMNDSSDLLAMINQYSDLPDGGSFNVFRLLPSQEVAGMAAYLRTDAAHGNTEVGFVGHGLVMARTPASTEAHYLLARHVFDSNGYRRLEWKCDASNEPSTRAALRYGYSYEGCFRHHRVTARGTNRDTKWYSIIDSEWPKCKEAWEAWLDPTNFDQDGKQKRTLESFRTTTWLERRFGNREGS